MRAHRLSPLLWCFGDREKPRPRGFTFVLAPFAAGSAYSFAPWIPHLVGPGDSAIVLQYPGRGPRAAEPAPASLSALADTAADELAQRALGVPVLVGHSMGGVLAYEIAVRLEARAMDIALLVVSSARPPALTDMDPARILAMSARDWLAQIKEDGDVDADILCNPELMSLTIQVLRADSLLLARHPAQGQAVKSRILAIGGLADPGISSEHLGAWRALTTGHLATRLWPGGHFYYRDKIPDVVAFIRSALTPRVSA